MLSRTSRRSAWEVVAGADGVFSWLRLGPLGVWSVARVLRRSLVIRRVHGMVAHRGAGKSESDGISMHARRKHLPGHHLPLPHTLKQFPGSILDQSFACALVENCPTSCPCRAALSQWLLWLRLRNLISLRMRKHFLTKYKPIMSEEGKSCP